MVNIYPLVKKRLSCPRLLADYTTHFMPRKSLIEAPRPKGRKLPGKVVSFCIVPPWPRPEARVFRGHVPAKESSVFEKPRAI
jgi:hypothetical protein